MPFLFSAMGGCALAGRVSPASSDASTAAHDFVDEYAVGLDAPDLRTVRSLVRALCSRRLFTKVDRRRMRQWHRDPERRAKWLERMDRLAATVERLESLAATRLLDGEEASDLRRAGRSLLDMHRKDAAWRQVYDKAAPADYPFVLTGRKALELRVLDGCTTYSRAFCVLANAAGIEARLVGSSDLDTLRRVVRPGQEPLPGIVNGHKMVLVKLEGCWHLVNTSYYAPDRDPAYEIFAELDGEPISPETLRGKVLRLPSMQVADGRRSPELLVTSVGAPGADNLGEQSLASNMNLSVSGDPENPLCQNPALGKLLEPQR